MSRDAEPRDQTRLYDKRTVERNIKKGLITRKDYEKHMKSLEDVADKGSSAARRTTSTTIDEAAAGGRRGRDRRPDAPRAGKRRPLPADGH